MNNQIEKHMRIFVKSLFPAKYFNNLLLLTRFKLINRLHSLNLISWKLTWSSLNYREIRGTSFISVTGQRFCTYFSRNKGERYYSQPRSYKSADQQNDGQIV